MKVLGIRNKNNKTGNVIRKTWNDKGTKKENIHMHKKYH